MDLVKKKKKPRAVAEKCLQSLGSNKDVNYLQEKPHDPLGTTQSLRGLGASVVLELVGPRTLPRLRRSDGPQVCRCVCIWELTPKLPSLWASPLGTNGLPSHQHCVHLQTNSS